jgi:hypothetical protein
VERGIKQKMKSLMKIKIIRNCISCFFHYYKDQEDDECYEDGGCSSFSPVGLRIEDVELIVE